MEITFLDSRFFRPLAEDIGPSGWLDERMALFSRIEIAIALHKAIAGLDTSLIQSSGKLPSAFRSACGVGSISTGIDGVISTVRRSDTSMWARLRVFLIRTMRRSLSFSQM